MLPQSTETAISGKWIFNGTKMCADAACERIEWLTQHHFRQVAVMDNGWTTLFFDSVDGRFWERTFPQSEMHGGGPPRLAVISYEEAQIRYLLDKSPYADTDLCDS
jgi:hypothetical protein